MKLRIHLLALVILLGLQQQPARSVTVEEMRAVHTLMRKATLARSDDNHYLAVRYGKEAVKKAEEIYGPDSFRVAQCLQSLAETYSMATRYYDAELTLKDAVLRMKRAHLSEVEMQICRDALADALINQGKTREARALAEHGLEVRMQLAGPLDRLLDTDYHLIGKSYLRERDWQNALRYLRIAARCVTENVATSTFDSKRVRISAAIAAMGAKQWDEAKKYIDQMNHSTKTNSVGLYDLAVNATLYQTRARLMNDPELEKKTKAEALRLWQLNSENDRERAAIDIWTLGWMYQQQCQDEVAKSIFIDCLELSKGLNGPHILEVREAVNKGLDKVAKRMDKEKLERI